MFIGEHRFHCRFIEQAYLPVYKGSTFRGAFGSALKKVVCAVRDKNCGQCLLACRCLYARTFEPAAPTEGLRQATLPHPYVIRPPSSRKTRYAAGEEFVFELRLFGAFNDSLPYFVYAFETMGEQGLGAGRKHGQGRYILEHIHSGEDLIYEHEARKLAAARTRTLSLASPQAAIGDLTLHLLTPLRLKFANQLQAELPFHLLVRALLRRISSLFASYGTEEPPLDYRGLVARAAEVRIKSSRLHWHDWQRYSSRQEQSMFMGGMSGQVSYQGAIGEYLPLFELGRELHLGKQSAFGLGRIDFDFLPETAA
jgi:hypothetical protein